MPGSRVPRWSCIRAGRSWAAARGGRGSRWGGASRAGGGGGWGGGVYTGGEVVGGGPGRTGFEVGRAVSDALVEVMRRVDAEAPLAFVGAKGGITASGVGARVGRGGR